MPCDGTSSWVATGTSRTDPCAPSRSATASRSLPFAPRWTSRTGRSSTGAVGPPPAARGVPPSSSSRTIAPTTTATTSSPAIAGITRVQNRRSRVAAASPVQRSRAGGPPAAAPTRRRRPARTCGARRSRRRCGRWGLRMARVPTVRPSTPRRGRGLAGLPRAATGVTSSGAARPATSRARAPAPPSRRDDGRDRRLGDRFGFGFGFGCRRRDRLGPGAQRRSRLAATGGRDVATSSVRSVAGAPRRRRGVDARAASRRRAAPARRRWSHERRLRALGPGERGRGPVARRSRHRREV